MTIFSTTEIPVAEQPSPKELPIARVLRDYYPEVRLRQRFLKSPYLEQVTLGQVLASPSALDAFLETCRQLPHCGETSIGRLRSVIGNLADFETAQT